MGAPSSGQEGPLEPDEEDEVEQSALYRKLYNRMEAKIRRMCTPTPASGKISASPELIDDWRSKGCKRTTLVKLMIESDGDKVRERETERETESERVSP